MNCKRLRKLQASFEKRGGRFWMSPDTPPEVTAALLEQLLDCPDCRAAVLEATNADEGRKIDIDATIRALALRGDH